jgi:uncharacterized protein (TIGR02246 family)
MAPFLGALLALPAFGWGGPPDDVIPIERCDRLPTVTVHVGGSDMHFLLDTGATTILNLKSFSSGKSKQIQISSWQGSAATSAKEVSIDEFALGSHKLTSLKLPAIDLSPIGKACGGAIDGILGVDILDRMGVTIDLKRRIASIDATPQNTTDVFAEMERSMDPCNGAFNLGNADELAECFDPEIVLYTPDGEFRGRKQVMSYLTGHYLKYAPDLHFSMVPHDVRSFGDALWYSYDYTIEVKDHAIEGHGMAMCRKQDGRWRMLNMHNSLRNGQRRSDVQAVQ